MYRVSLCTEVFAEARLEAAGAARHGLGAAPLTPHTPRAQQRVGWGVGGGGALRLRRTRLGARNRTCLPKVCLGWCPPVICVSMRLIHGAPARWSSPGPIAIFPR